MFFYFLLLAMAARTHEDIIVYVAISVLVSAALWDYAFCIMFCAHHIAGQAGAWEGLTRKAREEWVRTGKDDGAACRVDFGVGISVTAICTRKDVERRRLWYRGTGSEVQAGRQARWGRSRRPWRCSWWGSESIGDEGRGRKNGEGPW